MTAFAEGAQERVWLSFAAEMAEAPALIRQMIKEHRSDDDGRCSSARCTAGGLGYGLHWPCTLYAVAAEALRLLDQPQITPETAQKTGRRTARRTCLSAQRARGAADASSTADELPSGEELVAEVLAVDPLDTEIRTFFDAQGMQDTGLAS